MSYYEELTAGNPTHPSVITVRTGVKKDGRMVARKLKAIHNSGAYGAFKPVVSVSIGGASHAGGPYRINHTFFEAIQVYTNTVPSGFFRAPGAPQTNFAVESHNDLIAKALDMDPAEFRLKNIIEDGEENAVGERQQEVKARDALQAALDAFGWKRGKRGSNTGRGIAIYDRHVGSGPTGATLVAGANGTITIISPTFDQGVGTHTVLRQIVAKEFQLPMDRVEVVVGDTDTAPRDSGAGAMRVTNIAGTAVLQASDDLRKQLASHAAEILECAVEEIVQRGEKFWPREDPRRALMMGDIVKRGGQDGILQVTANVNPEMRRDITCYSAQIAEVEVDTETGQFRVTRFVTSHDVGTIINPTTHQGQIEGGLLQGIG
ncbi:MAG: molybdopterin cofactor-binding domain-containing protein, partial [Saprospiraceae bacterium]|nr:molybdopterin cofactor-binding domain-containing protein [Saprospiraceae bacterium]